MPLWRARRPRPGVEAFPLDRGTIWVLLAFASVIAVSAAVWRDYWTLSLAELDPLLAACWIGMRALALHRVDLARDRRLALVAFAGGALIESWGTRAGLWTYFNGDEPPLFILPAWPAAALATERVVQLLLSRAPAGRRTAWNVVYLAVVPGTAAALAWWCRGALSHPLTWIAGACIVVTCATSTDRRADVLRLAAGAFVGYPLELWGTTSGCWTYASGGTPPVVAVLAHGFATVAFARGVSFAIVVTSRARARARASPPARRGSTASAETPPAPST